MEQHDGANTQIIPFDFNGHQIRVLTADDGEPLWIASDVAKVLGYRMASDMTRRLDADEKGTRSVRTPGGEQEVSIISEPGLYSAILGSKVPEAKAFKRWVTHEVLPAIRRHGTYMTEQTIEKVLTDPDTIIKLATDLKAERERRAELEAQAALDAPKVVFADAVAVSNTAILIGDLAKILKGNGVPVGANRLFGWMRDNGFLINRRGMDWNMPTQRAMELELFKVKETVVTHSDGHTSISKTTKVTGKGQRYFVERFLDGRFEVAA